MKNKTLLLVEDEVLIAMDEKMTLEKYGYSVITASSGEKAIEAVRTNSGIDLILMDIDLGKGLDGTEAAEIILRDRDLPVVFLSSHTEPEVVEKTEKITSYGYVVKNSGATVLEASIKMAFKLFDANLRVRESEEVFSKIFKFSPIGISITQVADGKLFDVNDAWRNIMGFSKEEAVGHDIGELKLIDRETQENIREKFFANGRLSNLETEFTTKNGQKRAIITTAEPVSIKGKQYAINLVTDITELKKAEELIREKDIKLRKLFANVPDLVYQFTRKPDGSYCCPVASQGVRNIFGCEPEDVVDSFEPIARVIYPEDMKRVMDSIEYSAEHLTYFTCEFRVQIPGREIQWIYSRSTPERLPDGSVTWFGFNVDITERKRTEEALRESEVRLQTILDHSPLLISEFDIDGRYIMASPATAAVFNMTPDQLVGKTFSELLPPETVTVFKRRIDKIRETLQPLQIEDRLESENGTCCFLTTLFPLLDRGGQLQTIGSIAQKITTQQEEVRTPLPNGQRQK